MIDIIDKHNCCGCSACVQRCTKQCISLQEDEEGFLYPKVEISSCIKCGLCEIVCPVLVPYDPLEPACAFAAINPDDYVRLHSSSGGVFSLLAQIVIDNKGVVFGAAFDESWGVHHVKIDNSDNLFRLRGSKYVQSNIGDTYREAEENLKCDRLVLFSGTPCQIAGLNHYLRKDYDNLITVDVVCHGVPSPRVWRDYVTSLRRPKGTVVGKNTVLSSLNNTPSIVGISFRDKQKGWKKYGFVVRYSADHREGEKFGLSPVKTYYEERESLYENLFMRGFQNNLYLRPSCHNCPAKGGKSHSDITIADFWGIENVIPNINDDKGVSLVLINTEKGKKLWEALDLTKYPTDYHQAIKYNVSFEHSVPVPKMRVRFWKEYNENGLSAISSVLESMRPNAFKRVAIWCYNSFINLVSNRQ